MSHGDGFDTLFRSLGAAVASLGEAVKPPAGRSPPPPIGWLSRT
jgi:hypothetical protein